MSADARFKDQETLLGYSFDGEIKIGGHYVPLVQDGRRVYLSGQIPRVGDRVVCVGSAGYAVSQLPKGATVEIDLVATVREASSPGVLGQQG